MPISPIYLVDPGGQQFQLTVDDTGQLGRTEVSGQAAVASVSINDSTYPNKSYAISILAGHQLSVAAIAYSAVLPTQLLLQSPSGFVFAIVVVQGNLLTQRASAPAGPAPGATKAYSGYGSKLYYSLDNITYTPVAQLQRFEPTGSRQAMIDQTSLRTPDNYTRPFAAQVDSGELDFAGVYDGDLTQLVLNQLHGQRTLAWFRVVLSDGSAWQFQGYVSEMKPFSVAYSKFIAFSGKLRIWGGIASPVSLFDPAAFDPAAFQTLLT